MASPSSYKVDFYTIKNEEIIDMTIPIQWKISYTGVIHGIYIYLKYYYYNYDYIIYLKLNLYIYYYN